MRKKSKAVDSVENKQEKGSASKREPKWMTGGETHQTTDGKHPALTTNQGVALADNQNSLRGCK